MGLEASAIRLDSEQQSGQQPEEHQVGQSQQDKQQEPERKQSHKGDQVMQDQTIFNSCGVQNQKLQQAPAQAPQQQQQQQSQTTKAEVDQRLQQQVEPSAETQQQQLSQQKPPDPHSSHPKQHQQIDMHNSFDETDSPKEPQKKKAKNTKLDSCSSSKAAGESPDSFEVIVVDSITQATISMLVNNKTSLQRMLEAYCHKQGFSTTERKLSYRDMLIQPGKRMQML